MRLLQLSLADRSLGLSTENRLLLQEAEQEARKHGRSYLAPVDLALAALKHGDEELSEVLTRRGFDGGLLYSRVSNAVEASRTGTSPPERTNKRHGLPWTSRVLKLLRDASLEAKRRKDPRVGPLHVLMALLRSGVDPAGLLEQAGLTLNELAAPLSTGRDGQALFSRFTIAVDDDSELPIYEQIVQQVREAIATRQLHAGDRLPTVRSLADRLNIAPGTVARAYAELEREQLVVTQGVGGTRIATPELRKDKAPLRGKALSDSLRRVIVGAFHDGVTAAEIRLAVDAAMEGIY